MRCSASVAKVCYGVHCWSETVPQGIVVWIIGDLEASGNKKKPPDMTAVHRLVIVRHGESEWNQENRFCGWFDADLSEKGVEEARRGAKAVKEAGMKFDVCYTSVLKRAVKTLWTIMEITDQMWVPVHRTWRLNERHYGGLTGLNKAETAEKHGEEQVKIWRRSFDTPPPPMDKEHAYHKIISEVRGEGLPPGGAGFIADTSSRFHTVWMEEYKIGRASCRERVSSPV